MMSHFSAYSRAGVFTFLLLFANAAAFGQIAKNGIDPRIVAKATAGDAKAQYNLGYMYLHGEGVQADREKAFAWLQKAADKGYGDMNQLRETPGIMLDFKGVKVGQSVADAIRILELSGYSVRDNEETYQSVDGSGERTTTGLHTYWVRTADGGQASLAYWTLIKNVDPWENEYGCGYDTVFVLTSHFGEVAICGTPISGKTFDPNLSYVYRINFITPFGQDPALYREELNRRYPEANQHAARGAIVTYFGNCNYGATGYDCAIRQGYDGPRSMKLTIVDYGYRKAIIEDVMKQAAKHSESAF